MAAAPLPPVSAPVPAPAAASLSEGARIVNTFMAPSKTFTDLRRNASWWAPWLLLSSCRLRFSMWLGKRSATGRIAENQVQASAKTAARMDQLPADQRDRALERQAKGTQYFLYGYPVVILLFNTDQCLGSFWHIQVGRGADVKFKTSFAIVMYAGLPGV